MEKNLQGIKYTRWAHALTNVVGAFIGIAQNLMVILSLGWYCPGWELEYLCWRSRRKYEATKTGR